MIRFSSIALALLCVIWQAGPVWCQQKLAFISGVERYSKSGLKNLDFAEDDAKALQTELTRLGFKVDVVIGD